MSPAGTGNGSDGAPEGFDVRTGGLGSAAQILALSTLCGVLFLTFLDNTIVSVGLANVQSDLHAGVTSLQWVVNGYALTFASFMLVAGMLGDLLGRKRIMLAGVAIFSIGSVVGALAGNVDWLIAARVIMGIGAAASEPGTLSIIRHVYPDRKTRADALGIWAAVSGLALALGPVIGGALVGFSSWRAIFWFNLGFGVVAFVLAAIAVPESSDRQGRRIDVLGFLFGAAFLACLSFAVIQGEESGYTTDWIVALFVLCGVSGVAFVMTEHRVKSPMLDLSLFRRPPFTGSNFVAFAAYFGTFSIFFFTALYLQVVANAVGVSDRDRLPADGGRTHHRLCAHGAIGGSHRRPLAHDDRLPPRGRGHPHRGRGVGPDDRFRHTGLGPAPRRHRPRHAAGTGYVRPVDGRQTRAFGHGSVGNQHQPRNGRRVRRGHPRFHRQRQADRRPGRPFEGDRHSAELPEPGGTCDPNGRRIERGCRGQCRTLQERRGRRDREKVVNAAYDAFGSGLHEALLISGCLILAGAVVAFFTIHRVRGETYEV